MNSSPTNRRDPKGLVSGIDEGSACSLLQQQFASDVSTANAIVQLSGSTVQQTIAAIFNFALSALSIAAALSGRNGIAAVLLVINVLLLFGAGGRFEEYVATLGAGIAGLILGYVAGKVARGAFALYVLGVVIAAVQGLVTFCVYSDSPRPSACRFVGL